MLIVYRISKITWTARSTRSFSEACVLILLAFSPIAMSQTSALCRPIATASSASNCCKCLANRTMILPYCPPQKRNRRGSLLRPRQRISPLTGNDSSPLKRLHLLPNQRLFLNTSSVKDKGVSVEGLQSLTHTPSASTRLLRIRVQHLRPTFWPVGRKPLLILKPKRLIPPTEKPQTPRVTPSNLHQGRLRLSPEKTRVKLIAGRVDREATTLEIAPATPRESHSCPKTSHFDRSWLSKHSRLLRLKQQYESWIHTISPSVTIA